MVEPRFIKLSLINEDNYNKASIDRARTLSVEKLYVTEKHVAYAVRDLFKNTEHTVIYESEKLPPLDWTCDCEWYTTRTINNGKYCAHVLAVQFWRKV